MKPNKCHLLHYVRLQNTSCYMFQGSMEHLEGAHNCTEQLLNISCMQQCSWKLLCVIYTADRVVHWKQ